MIKKSIIFATWHFLLACTQYEPVNRCAILSKNDSECTSLSGSVLKATMSGAELVSAIEEVQKEFRLLRKDLDPSATDVKLSEDRFDSALQSMKKFVAKEDHLYSTQSRLYLIAAQARLKALETASEGKKANISTLRSKVREIEMRVPASDNASLNARGL